MTVWIAIADIEEFKNALRGYQIKEVICTPFYEGDGLFKTIIYFIGGNNKIYYTKYNTLIKSKENKLEELREKIKQKTKANKVIIGVAHLDESNLINDYPKKVIEIFEKIYTEEGGI